MKWSQYINRIVPIYRRGKNRYFQSFGRDETLYVEGEKRLRIYTELRTAGFFGKLWNALSLDGVPKQWEPPHDEEILTLSKRQEIFVELCKYYDAIGHAYVIEDPNQLLPRD